CDYPLMTMEIANLMGIRSKYITNERKLLQLHLDTNSMEYDINNIDDKHINRIILDISKVFKLDLTEYKSKLINLINIMNDRDILINNNVTTRVNGILYLLLMKAKDKNIAIDQKAYCKACHISENTFRKFQ